MQREGKPNESDSEDQKLLEEGKAPLLFDKYKNCCEDYDPVEHKLLNQKEIHDGDYFMPPRDDGLF